MKGDQYLHFDPGSLSSTCAKTKLYREELFMPHHKLQVCIHFSVLDVLCKWCVVHVLLSSILYCIIGIEDRVIKLFSIRYYYLHFLHPLHLL